MNQESGSSYAARLGTAKHTLSETVVTTGMDADAFLGTEIEVEGERFSVDDEFVKDVTRGVDMLWEVIGMDDGKMLMEEQVDLSHIVGPGESGHVDVAYISDERKKFYTLDYKYGRKPVAAERNPSLLLYTSGVAEKHFPKDERIEDWTFVLGILQPAAGTPSVWELSGAELANELTILKAICARTYEDDAPLAMGNHCFFCQAKAICPEMQREVGSAVFDDPEFDNLDTPVQPDKLSPEQAARILGSLDAVEQWVKEFREYWKDAWMKGTDLPGWKVVPGKKGSRQWTDKKAAEELMATKFRLPAKTMYSQNLITPSAAEKLLAESSPKRWNQLQELIKHSQQQPAFAPETSPTPAIERSVDDSPFA
jgi:hypothetical protein